MMVKRCGFFQAATLTMAAVMMTVCATTSAARGEDGEARDLLKRVLDAAPAIPFIAKLKLTVQGGVVRELELQHKRLGDARASYLEVTAPLNLKDTRFLFFERTERADEQFIYIPSMKRVTQIGENARKQPFLGSEYYVSDLVTPQLDAFTYRFVGEETLLGRACKLVESVPKTPANELYSKTVLAVEPTDLLLLRVEFSDEKGKPLKVWTVDKLEKIDGLWTPLQQRMTNLQEHVESRLEITEIKYNATVPDDVFDRAHLAR